MGRAKFSGRDEWHNNKIRTDEHPDVASADNNNKKNKYRAYPINTADNKESEHRL